MKKALLILFILAIAILIAGSYFLNRRSFLCPIEYKGEIIIRSDSRGDGFFAANRRGRRTHEGIDLFAPLGVPVLASRLGWVISARQNHGMGKYVIIKHLGGYISIYGHLSEIYVKKGRFVWQETIIGSVGKTGNANSRNIQPHLHFEIRKNGIPLDPLEYIE